MPATISDKMNHDVSKNKKNITITRIYLKNGSYHIKLIWLAKHTRIHIFTYIPYIIDNDPVHHSLFA